MDKKSVAAVCEKIYKQFPEMKGIQPIIKPQGNDITLLIFHNTFQTSNGQNIQRTVRVVVNQDGKIIKITTSR